MLTSPEQREEASRLLDLDDRGRLVEALALMLRLGEQQENAMQELIELDRGFIKEIDGRRSEDSLSIEVPMEGSSV